MIKNEKKSPLRRVALVVRGVVQGVGFRPFVYNAARSRRLAGWVSNEADLVRIEVQGSAGDVADFLGVLRDHPPAQAKIEAIEIADLTCLEEPPRSFEIHASDEAASPGPTIPADLAACADCLAEIFDPAARRYLYPFTNCTNCGPRWSIVEALPYDRPRTSMKAFAMCNACLAEYENPADRRFHAQPIACPKCGPQLQLLDHRGLEIANDLHFPALEGKTGDKERSIFLASESIKAGKLLAMKGLGGFQLIVDATNPEAVALLRERKRRPDRPFALMMRSLDDVRRYCEVSDDETRMLASHQAPIVLLRRNALSFGSRLNDSSLASNISPGNPYLGVMLPYTPLHHLLMAEIDRPVVCTSGNLSEEPMAISLEDALSRLGRIADLFLTHDRPIVRPVDDSIVRFGSAGVQTLRRARGFAPLPISVRNPDGRTILALGGHLKNTIGLCLGTNKGEGGRGKAEGKWNLNPPSSTILSAHIGDLDSAASVEVFRRAIDDLLRFYRVAPDAIACDLHPDYASTRAAEELASRFDAPLVRVQHHRAHVAACMAERDLTGPVLGFAWDGTGYGGDGTIWGGEAFVCHSQNEDFSRASHLRTFPLPGGDAAARRPRRSALGVLYEIFGEDAVKYVEGWFPPGELKTLMQMLRRGTNCPRTSSMGRLFDAVAALVGLPPADSVITFEGQAAMALEFIVSTLPKGEGLGVRVYQLPLQEKENNLLIADWEPTIREILADLSAGETASEISLRFHDALAEMAVSIAGKIGIREVVLSGGCFQNALLLHRTHFRLTQAGYRVFTPVKIPPGDGGIALGQVFIAGLAPAIE
jgi:hydrogenase maturation protein HypF